MELTALDLYTPWRETADSLAARHVNRDAELEAITDGAEQFLAGASPLPLYLFGPRGAGKSHLLAVARHRLEGHCRVVLIPEDIASTRRAERLMDRIDRLMHRAHPNPDDTREVVLLEGFDRHLHALGIQERRSLRRLIDLRPQRWWVTTGVTLPGELTGKEEAFYGAFDPWPLEPLDDKDANALLDALAAADDPRWPARRATLTTVAGGNPRALVALGRACRQHPSRWASDQLHTVIRDFTAHYQMRFRDLSPQAQQIVEILAESPREVTPSELAEMLDSTASQMSVQASRLVDEGHLRQRSEGRQSYYRLAEPLFRYWLEYRTADWSETRTGWLSRLLEAMMSPIELADAWWEHPEADLRAAVVAVMRHGDASVSHAWRHLLAETRAAEPGIVDEAIERARELPPSPGLRTLAARALAAGLGERFAALSRAPEVGWALDEMADLAAVLRFDQALREGTAPPRAAFLELVETLDRVAADLSAYDREMLLEAVIAALGQHRRGGPWKLRGAERARVARVPGLRAYFAEHGRLPSHPPLIDPDDITAQLGPGPRIPDAARLIVVAAVHGHDALLRCAARAFGHDSDFAFPPCPNPTAVLAADSAAALVDAAVRALAGRQGLLRAMLARVVVSWSASLGQVDPARFEALSAHLSRASDGPLEAEGDELALAVLAARDPSRLDALAEALGPRWAETCDDARLLATTLNDPTRGRLHPELERLRQRLDTQGQR